MLVQPFATSPCLSPPGAFENLRQAVIRRFQMYIALGEENFEHLLLIVTC